jgi:methylenetetrahydrofolate dehydrogenase (NADP+) / methenyltetrahydrofolate cyclohydrolase
VGILLSGRRIADEINQRTAGRIAELRSASDVTPTMALITTEEGGLLKQTQIRLHVKAANALGVAVRTHVLGADATEQDVIAAVEVFNKDSEVHGILVLLPLQREIRQHIIFGAIHPDKEMEGVASNDGFVDAEEIVDVNNETFKVSSTLAAIRLLLEQIDFDPIRSRNVFLAGDQVRDNIVVARLLEMASRANVQVAVAWASELNARTITRQAELVLVSVGSPELVDDTYLRQGAVVIDFAPVFVGERYAPKQGKMVPVLKNGVSLDAALHRQSAA